LLFGDSQLTFETDTRPHTVQKGNLGMYENSSRSSDVQMLTFAARPSAASLADRFQVRDKAADFRRCLPQTEGLRAHLRRIRDARSLR
jgi:hypothetical protein